MSQVIYTATYSGVDVVEMVVRGIAVMKRKTDNWLNATQLLKVAGIEKGKRTKILEREVLPGEHEKVQGGYGKYQGTWVPFGRGRDLAKQYKVEPYLRTLFDYDVSAAGDMDNATPTKEMALMAQKVKDNHAGKGAKSSPSPRMSPSVKRPRSTSAKPPSQTFSAPSMTPSPLHPSFAQSPSIPPSPQWHADAPPKKKLKMVSSPSILGDDFSNNAGASGGDHSNFGKFQPKLHDPEELLEGGEKYRAILMAIFLNDEAEPIPSLLTSSATPVDLDIDLVIDDQGHTALHWASALARIPILELLVRKQADVRRVNYNGESALVRAVLVTNNFDKQSFPMLLDILPKAIPIVDRKNRTLLHHIAVTAGIRGRGSSAHYYMECLLEWIAKNGGDFSSLIDIQDKNGDTALTIAARIGDRYLAKVLIDVGANRDIENKVGLKAEDFGIDDTNSTDPPFAPRTYATADDADAKAVLAGRRGKEIMPVVQKMVDELDAEFSQEIMARQAQLLETQSQLRQVTRDLTETRRTISQCRSQVHFLAEAHQKIGNLETSLEEETQKTRSQIGYDNSLQTGEDIDLLFNLPANKSNGAGTEGGDVDMSGDGETKAKEEKVLHEIHQLRARIEAYTLMEAEAQQELSVMAGKSSAKELQCKKVVAICCNIPLDSVDDLLVPLTLAVESDGASLDLSRVAGFMSRVKRQEGLALQPPA